MGYVKTDWKNKNSDGSIPEDAPAINADNLNKIENGIEASINKDIGFISFYCNSVAPKGWLVCDGRAVSREIYADLHKVIGEQFGAGDGITTFNLPDLRGQFIRGWNSENDGIDANREFATTQNATRFTASRSGSRYVEGGEDESYTYYSNDGSSWSSATTSIGVRPNNIALLPCIYTGVFDD